MNPFADYAQLWRECEARARRREQRAQRRETRQNLAAAFAELDRLERIIRSINAKAHPIGTRRVWACLLKGWR